MHPCIPPFAHALHACIRRIIMIINRICGMNSVTKLMTSKPMGALESIVSITHSSNESRRLSEQFDLDLAMKYIAMPLLNKRIQGINDIKDYIEWTQKKEEYQAKV